MRNSILLGSVFVTALGAAKPPEPVDRDEFLVKAQESLMVCITGQNAIRAEIKDSLEEIDKLFSILNRDPANVREGLTADVVISCHSSHGNPDETIECITRKTRIPPALADLLAIRRAQLGDKNFLFPEQRPEKWLPLEMPPPSSQSNLIKLSHQVNECRKETGRIQGLSVKLRKIREQLASYAERLLQKILKGKK